MTTHTWSGLILALLGTWAGCLSSGPGGAGSAPPPLPADLPEGARITELLLDGQPVYRAVYTPIDLATGQVADMGTNQTTTPILTAAPWLEPAFAATQKATDDDAVVSVAELMAFLNGPWDTYVGGPDDAGNDAPVLLSVLEHNTASVERFVQAYQREPNLPVLLALLDEATPDNTDDPDLSGEAVLDFLADNGLTFAALADGLNGAGLTLAQWQAVLAQVPGGWDEAETWLQAAGGDVGQMAALGQQAAKARAAGDKQAGAVLVPSTPASWHLITNGSLTDDATRTFSVLSSAQPNPAAYYGGQRRVFEGPVFRATRYSRNLGDVETVVASYKFTGRSGVTADGVPGQFLLNLGPSGIEVKQYAQHSLWAGLSLGGPSLSPAGNGTIYVSAGFSHWDHDGGPIQMVFGRRTDRSFGFTFDGGS